MRPELAALAAEFAGRAALLTVYIAEAHAADEWPIGASAPAASAPADDAAPLPPPAGPVLQHRDAGARRAAARAFAAAGWPTPLALDALDDGALRLFGAWPLRVYVIHRGRVAHKSQPRGADECGYVLGDVRDALVRVAHSAGSQ